MFYWHSKCRAITLCHFSTSIAIPVIRSLRGKTVLKKVSLQYIKKLKQQRNVTVCSSLPLKVPVLILQRRLFSLLDYFPVAALQSSYTLKISQAEIPPLITFFLTSRQAFCLWGYKP